LIIEKKVMPTLINSELYSNPVYFEMKMDSSPDREDTDVEGERIEGEDREDSSMKEDLTEFVTPQSSSFPTNYRVAREESEKVFTCTIGSFCLC
jgi:hypothetical protein